MSVNVFSDKLLPLVLVTFVLATLAPFRANCVSLAPQSQDVGACELIAHPEQFNKKQVRVRARLDTVVIEGGMWLYGDSCRKEGMILLLVPDAIRKHPEEHPDYASLRDAILKEGNFGTAGKNITATFSGKFGYARKKRPKRTLILERVENLETSGSATHNKDGAG